jgi:hypothetical protein
MGNGVAEYKGEKVAPGFEHSVSFLFGIRIAY